MEYVCGVILNHLNTHNGLADLYDLLVPRHCNMQPPLVRQPKWLIGNTYIYCYLSTVFVVLDSHRTVQTIY